MEIVHSEINICLETIKVVGSGRPKNIHNLILFWNHSRIFFFDLLKWRKMFVEEKVVQTRAYISNDTLIFRNEYDPEYLKLTLKNDQTRTILEQSPALGINPQHSSRSLNVTSGS